MSDCKPRPCHICGASREGLQSKYGRCSDCEKARVLRYRAIPCANCGDPIQKTRHSARDGAAMCRPCRKDRQYAAVSRCCERCGEHFDVPRPTHPKRFCSTECANRRASDLPAVRSLDDARASRRARVQDAPGLGYSAMKRLRAKWLKQRLGCIYCGNLATTIDHVLPLVRGGTNHEGNLAPCCKRCNSSKSGWTVIEWRTGKRLPPMTNPLPWTYDRRRTAHRTISPVVGDQLALLICDVCSQLTLTKTCSYECQRVRARNDYRKRAGIPIDAPLTGKGRPRTRVA